MKTSLSSTGLPSVPVPTTTHLVDEGVVHNFALLHLAERVAAPRVGVDFGSSIQGRLPHNVPSKTRPDFFARVRSVEHGNLGRGCHPVVLMERLDRIVAEAVGIRKALPVALVRRAERIQVKHAVVEIFVDAGSRDAPSGTPRETAVKAFLFGNAGHL